MSIITKADGIYPRLSREQYDAIPALNQSSIKNMLKSPFAYKHGIEDSDDEVSTDLVIGQMVSCLWLEGKAVADKMFVVKPDEINRRGAKNQAIYDEWMKEHAHATVISRAAHDKVQGIVDGLNRNEELCRLIKGNNILREVTVLWTDPVTGRRCKGMIDALDMDSGAIFDLKTTSGGVDADSFSRAIWNYGYHFQAAFYMDALEAIGQGVDRYGLIPVEKKAPYESTLYWLDPDAIEIGRRQYRSCIGRIIECEENGTWPGPEMGQSIGLPGYATRINGSSEIQQGTEE